MNGIDIFGGFIVFILFFLILSGSVFWAEKFANWLEGKPKKRKQRDRYKEMQNEITWWVEWSAKQLRDYIKKHLIKRRRHKRIHADPVSR